MKSFIAGAVFLALSGTVALADRDNFTHGGERVLPFGGGASYGSFRSRNHSDVTTQPRFIHRSNPSFHRTPRFNPARGGRFGR